MKNDTVKYCYTMIVLLPFLMSSVYAESCVSPSLFNGLNIQIPCVTVDNNRFSTNLNNLPSGQLSWRWDGSLTPTSCSDDMNTCVTVNGLDLSFSSILINNHDYRAELVHAPELGQYDWRYSSHELNPATISESSLQELRNFINNAISTHQIPGAVLALAAGNQTLFLEAFGKSNVSQNTDVSVDTLFHIGSTHKALTSYLIAILVDEGVLQWDTRAIDIYPNLSLSNAQYAAQITIRQLLDMTSGLPKDADIVFSSPTRTILEGLSSVAFLSAPGEQYSYSNLSVSMAAYLAVLAKAKADNGSITQSDMDNLHAGYEQLLREKVLRAFGMTDSYLYVDDARSTGKMASSHHLENGRFVVSESVDMRVDNIAPAGGLKSTAKDMLGYMIAEMRQGLSSEGVRVASAANIAERQRLSPGPASSNEYGLCLEIKTLSNDLQYIGHAGSFDNFNSTIGFFPDKQIAFVLLTNGDSPEALELTSSGIEEKMAELLSIQP